MMLIPNLWYHLGVGVLFILSAILLVSYGYHHSFSMLNAWVHQWGKGAYYFFPVITHLGDALVLLSLLLVCHRINWARYIGVAVLALIGVGFVAYICKYYVFVGWDRPFIIAQQQHIQALFYHYPKGAGIERFHTFPSGHTATVVAGISTVLGLRRVHWSLQLLAVCMVGAVGISRIYIGVHFLGDVLAGGILGYLCAWAAIYVYHNVAIIKRITDLTEQKPYPVIHLLAILILCVQCYYRIIWMYFI